MYQTLLARIGKSLDASGLPYMVIGGRVFVEKG
jgi:hypothetical protein